MYFVHSWKTMLLAILIVLVRIRTSILQWNNWSKAVCQARDVCKTIRLFEPITTVRRSASYFLPTLQGLFQYNWESKRTIHMWASYSRWGCTTECILLIEPIDYRTPGRYRLVSCVVQVIIQNNKKDAKHTMRSQGSRFLGDLLPKQTLGRLLPQGLLRELVRPRGLYWTSSRVAGCKRRGVTDRRRIAGDPSNLFLDYRTQAPRSIRYWWQSQRRLRRLSKGSQGIRTEMSLWVVYIWVCLCPLQLVASTFSPFISIGRCNRRTFSFNFLHIVCCHHPHNSCATCHLSMKHCPTSALV